MQPYKNIFFVVTDTKTVSSKTKVRLKGFFLRLFIYENE